MGTCLLEGEEAPALLVNGGGRSLLCPRLRTRVQPAAEVARDPGTARVRAAAPHRLGHRRGAGGPPALAADGRAARAAALFAAGLRLQPPARLGRRHAGDQRDHPYSRQPAPVARRQADAHARDLPAVSRRRRRSPRPPGGGRDEVRGGDDPQLHAGLQGQARAPWSSASSTTGTRALCGRAHHELSHRGCAPQRALWPRGRRAAHAQPARGAARPEARHDRDPQRFPAGRTRTGRVGRAAVRARSITRPRTSQGEGRWPTAC